MTANFTYLNGHFLEGDWFILLNVESELRLINGRNRNRNGNGYIEEEKLSPKLNRLPNKVVFFFSNRYSVKTVFL